MIQEKDFLYRVPVKTAPITTPGGQIRNPEILVDVEGGEFMRGNILDANSTNKLINQSVKDAVDNKLIESGYVTKDLLEAETTRATEQENSLKTLIGAETSARTKGDEDLSSKIKAEQTRAEGKEKEISDKLAIVNGDSNTEGSFRKAIADVVAAAPEDLDTLKEIADKLAGNDDLHTALNQAITEKADRSDLIALEQKITANTTAIEGKQDKGNYVEYTEYNDSTGYKIDKSINFVGEGQGLEAVIANNKIAVKNTADKLDSSLSSRAIAFSGERQIISYGLGGIDSSRYTNCLATSDGAFKPISDFVLKTELPTVPTKTSQLTNDSNFITADVVDPNCYTFNDRDLKIGAEGLGYAIIGSNGISFGEDEGFEIDAQGFYGRKIDSSYSFSENGINVTTSGINLVIGPGSISCANGETNQFLIDSENIILGNAAAPNAKISNAGIKFAGKTDRDIPTAGGTFVELSSFASAEDISSLRTGLSKKQNKITVNEVDVTDIETADITKLRTIVTNLINALSESDLIRRTQTLE